MKNKPFQIGDCIVQPGERRLVELPASSLYTQTPISVPVHVINGKLNGEKLFVIAAVHGDEINGVEIIRRLLGHPGLKKLNGTLIAVPVANAYGLITLSRYLPDRRDLNRSFPGSKSGSLTSRLANLFMEHIISQCTYGIDLHTGNAHSENLPHVRINLSVKRSLPFARAFKAPVILEAKLRDGSIRQAASELNIPVILFEGGEALRFNELSIRIGLRGILNAMQFLKMLPAQQIRDAKKIKSKLSYYSCWARAPKSGIFFQSRQLGADVDKGEKLGFIADPFTRHEEEVYSPLSGIIIGRSTLPLINEGDALFHIARVKGAEEVMSEIDELRNYYISNPLEFY